MKSFAFLTVSLLVASVAVPFGGAGTGWILERVRQVTPGNECRVQIAGFDFDPQGRPVIGWMETGCGSPNALRWSRRQNGAWVTNTLAEPNIRAAPPDLAISPAGVPFFAAAYPSLFIFGGTWYGAHVVNLESEPTGPGASVLPIDSGQSCIASNPRFALAFRPGSATPETPELLVGTQCPFNGWLVRNGQALHGKHEFQPEVGTGGEFQSIDYAVLGDRSHVAYYAERGGPNWGAYYSNGTPGHEVLLTVPHRSGGKVSIAVGPDGRIHVAISNVPPCTGASEAGLLYATSLDGVTWTKTFVDVVGARDPSIDLDAAGQPRIAYWRGGSEVRLASLDSGSWSSTVVYTATTAAPTAGVRLAHDAANRPSIAFFNPDASEVQIASGGGLAGSPRFASAAQTVGEGAGPATIVVTRTGGSAGPLSINYRTSSGTATAVDDYTATSGTLTFADGETSRTFTIPIVNDVLDEPDETVNLTLGDTACATPSSVLTIVDNDEPPVYSITGQARDLNGSGIAGVTVTLGGAQSAAVTTGAEGRYAFTGLPGGSYTVTPSRNRFTFTPPAASLPNLSANQTVDFVGAPGFFTRYFAEGATGTFFDLSLALLNATDVPANVTLKYQKSDGAVLNQTLTLNPLSRVTVNPETLPGLEAADFSTVVEADVPVIADRTMRWDGRGYGSHAETSVASPATTWYLAEGATIGGFDLFYLIQNPNASAATVQVQYLLPAPAAPIVKTYTVGPESRFNIWVNQEHPVLDDAEVSSVLSVTNNVPVIVERAMYRPAAGLLFGAGHESAGVTAASPGWYLAEGATGSFFDLFILIANPNASDAAVEVRYLLPDGTVITKPYTVARNSRFNIWVDLEDARLADTAVSTTITSTNGVPLIVERAMWWPGGAATWQEGHNSAGAVQTGTKWGLADGEAGGALGTETYVLIANTSGAAGSARVRLFFEDGTTAERTFALNANSRFNVAVGTDFPAAMGKRFGVIVESLGASPAQIVVERAMSSNALGVTWAAGSNVIGTRLR